MPTPVPTPSGAFIDPDPVRPAASVPVLVLDTNAVLDLWLFADPRARALRAALQAGRVRGLVSPALLTELAQVLQRPFVAAWPVAAESVLQAWQAVSDCQPQPAAPAGVPRCTDADDQKFIDLAWAAPARWLVSRDRAVLRLARAARARGLAILSPEDWARSHAGPP